MATAAQAPAQAMTETTPLLTQAAQVGGSRVTSLAPPSTRLAMVRGLVMGLVATPALARTLAETWLLVSLLVDSASSVI